MLVRLLLVAAILAGLYFLARYLRRSPAAARLILRAVAVVGVAGLLFLLILRGGAEIAVPLLTVLAPLVLRWLGSRPLPSPSPSSTAKSGHSAVSTRFLDMSLDLATGAMAGKIREGRFAGRSLSDLALDELLRLWGECQVDPQSVAVLEAYLDRYGGSDWRDRLRESERQRSMGNTSTMERNEAYQVLGLQPGASREEIQQAYRRLIQRVHPDHGGSAYLAARLNQARMVLLSNV